MTKPLLDNYVRGEWMASSAKESLEVRNPATAELLARVPLSTRGDVDAAVRAARDAFPAWRAVPPVVRARHLFRFKALLEEHFDDLARIVTVEHGKTFVESQGSIRRGIENVEHACGIPTLMMGESLEDVAAGIDCETFRQPLGVFAAITPFNFPAMVPLWFWPYAVATGNTFVVKPSEQVPLSQRRLFELAAEAGFPPGVVNLVFGAREAAEALLEHPDVAGVSFVGSTPVARHVYAKGAETGKRVQALGGAKNHLVVMPDAALDATVSVVTESCFGCAGERCLAGAVVVAVGDVYEKLRDKLVAAANRIVLGNGLEPGVTMGPVISAAHRERIIGFIDRGVAQGAKLLVDGRGATVPGLPHGHWLGPSLFDEVGPDMELAREEVFGPVMVLRRAADLGEAIAQIRANRFANATSIFTTSGRAAREFKHEAGVSMMGVNIGVAAPMAFFPFGGTKSSFFGDLKAHGRDSIRFFTDAKVVISRWL
jgi:malonate-semialdehyde dehydrogenase (acetylating)/methylmalonate-semialdehyde dehydrogenase